MSFYYDQENDSYRLARIIGTVAVSILLLMALYPPYSVWSRELSGKAQLREAEWNKRIQTEEAKADLESATLNGQAEIERAKGAAEAMKIEGGNLTPQYIQYLWVTKNKFSDKTTIYVPTEGNLPILEAGRATR